MTTRRIIPPRVPFIDERTKTIAREWFLWLLEMKRADDETDLSAAFDAAIGVASAGETQKFAESVDLRAQFPKPASDNAQDLADLRLLQQRVQPIDYSPDIEAVRKLQAQRPVVDQTPEIDGNRLLAQPRPNEQPSAARIGARALVRI